MIRPRHLLLFSAACAAFAAGLFWNGGSADHGLISSAQAVIGRPLTPMSYAGVARRTTRRSVAVGAAAGAAAAGAAYAAPGCVQVADAYGRVVTRC